MSRSFVLGLACSAALSSFGIARAQCDYWESRFNPVGLDNGASAVVSFDDGSGPALYVGGHFTRAGLVDAARIARWDGSAWHEVGGGLPFIVNALLVHDFGSGPQLVAASGNTVRVYDGTRWTQLGNTFNAPVWSLCAFDEGSGPQLFAGGNFANNNMVPMRGIARWDGTSWNAVAGGVGLSSQSTTVYAMRVHDDGSGPALYVGGTFSGTDTITSPDLVRWNGTSWSAVGSGVDPDLISGVRALEVFDAGSGPRLILGGSFDSAGGVGASFTASWDGTNYAAFGTGLNSTVFALTTSAGELIAGGAFAGGTASPLQGSARLVGAVWQGMSGPGSAVYALTSFDHGEGVRVAGVGAFTSAQGNRVAEWNGSTWSPYDDGAGLVGQARCFAAFDDGSGPSLFVGGTLFSAGTVAATGIARWDGSHWQQLATQLANTVVSLVAWDDGSGRALYAGGTFQDAGNPSLKRIGRWDGTNWTALGTGIGGFSALDSVDALAVFDDGSGEKLYAGGVFNVAGDGTAVGIASWDGSEWSDLEIGTSGPVLDLATHDDGNGTALFVAGDFTSAGSVAANRIAKWDGSQWHALGSGAPNGSVSALAAFDDGSGMALYAAGNFTSMGGVAAQGLARWDGTEWYAVPKPFGSAQRLIVADLGDGPTLVASNSNAAWEKTASTWTQIGNFNGQVHGFGVYDSHGDGTPDLYVGGGFTTMFAGFLLSNGIASYSSCAQSGTTFCATGSMDICPCKNDGALGHGCANSVNADGALLSVSGVASVSNDSVWLTCSGLPPNTTTLFVQATGQANGGFGSWLGDGILCVSGAVLRLGSPNADGDVASVGFGTQTLPISVKGQIPYAGATRHYQARYRNVASYCTSATFNQSNGTSIVWAP